VNIDSNVMARVPLMGILASLTPENHVGMANLAMPGVHWMPKMNSSALLDKLKKLLPWRPG